MRSNVAISAVGGSVVARRARDAEPVAHGMIRFLFLSLAAMFTTSGR